MLSTFTAETFRYSGRDFTSEEMDWIRNLIASHPELHRLALSREVCRELSWLRPDGSLKDMSCRVAMLRMHRDGLIALPPPQTKNGNGKIKPKKTSRSDKGYEILLPVGRLGKLCFQIVSSKEDSSLWNELIERYHYLGYKPLPGAQIRYLVKSGETILAALGFGAAAWSVAPRDKYIGWTGDCRVKNLHMIVNNARFLILPWVKSKNLASKILAGVAKQIQNDWFDRYGYRPVLLETFVEKRRFRGTCYKAANWIHVGQTQGRGKLDRKHLNAVQIKDIFLYPLEKQFCAVLCE